MTSGHDGRADGSNPGQRTVFVYDAPYSLEGPELVVGDPLPDFELWQFRNGEGLLIDREAVLAYQMPAMFCCLHSVDTRVGAMQARRFEQILSRFDRSVMAFLVSSDMPFTQNRYSDHEMLAFLTIASDYRGVFARAFGVYLPDLMFLTRSVFIASADGVIQHADVVSEFSHQPDYDAAIDVLSELV